MTYATVILARARDDVQRIYDWIAERSVEGAERWFASFEEAILQLNTNPFLAPVAPEDEFVVPEIRQLLFRTRHGRTYRALFTVLGNQVRVLRVRGPGEPPLAPKELTAP
jgi:plasmid stabilization system protein ParE